VVPELQNFELFYLYQNWGI